MNSLTLASFEEVLKNLYFPAVVKIIEYENEFEKLFTKIAVEKSRNIYNRKDIWR